MNEQELLQVPVPSKTDSYSPVSHKNIINAIQENVDKAGLTVRSKSYRTNKKGTQVIGDFDIGLWSNEFDFRVSFRNSYDKSMSLAFVAGVSVMICSNGMIVGDMKFVRKHTGTVAKEIDSKITEAVQDYNEVSNKAEKDANFLKGIEVDDQVTAELCGRMFMEQKIITSSQLNLIKDEIASPSFEDFKDNNLWSLYNHTTHSLKKTHPTNYLDAHRDLHEFMTETVTSNDLVKV